MGTLIIGSWWRFHGHALRAWIGLIAHMAAFIALLMRGLSRRTPTAGLKGQLGLREFVRLCGGRGFQGVSNVRPGKRPRTRASSARSYSARAWLAWSSFGRQNEELGQRSTKWCPGERLPVRRVAP
jgi:hypothetical protein